MESILEIAHAILLIWWALCVIMFFVLLLYVLSIVSQARSMLKQTQKTYQQVMYFALAPLQKFADWLWDGDDQEDKDW